ncbi:MAG: Arc family DNA-binding protein [Hahellaceae bacterium]|jgi:plasmid stability protein|nr:Arc family DNA-binding protein [Hahellaceae bacterium]MCP5211600.1 Arc family DNA-binding protein [Hahellaceae bacterium]
MPAITIKNIPEALYSQLKQSAEAHHRSINSELIVCLEKVLVPQRINRDQLLTSARSMREKLKGLNITEADLSAAKTEGRE